MIDYVVEFFVIFIGYSAVIGFIIYKICQSVKKKRIILVKQTSDRFTALQDLNQRYHFYELPKTRVERYTLKSKREFDSFDPQTKMMMRVDDNHDLYEQLIQQTKYNKDLFHEYQRELDKLPITETTPVKRLKIYKYHQIENAICIENIQRPVLNIKYCVLWEYTSPQGRKHYHEAQSYNEDDINNFFRELKKTEIYKKSKSYQRSLMTPSLRYDVMRRDGFRCVLCGRTVNDGIKLHVDHIMPIAKGGKTVKSNLRTLCHECNLGKSDKYIEDELN